MVGKAGRPRIVFVTLIMGIFLVCWLAGCQSLGQRDMGRLVPDFYRVAIPQ
jgi:hypothetical protein